MISLARLELTLGLWNLDSRLLCLCKIRNSKRETRNKLQIQMRKTTNEEPDILRVSESSGREGFSCFEFFVSGFEFVSDFVLRISDLRLTVPPDKITSA
jgi:hypothetical protein